jgi:hypothetical protein
VLSTEPTSATTATSPPPRLTRMARWNETAAEFVTSTTCPRCEEGRIREGSCSTCGADLSGAIGDELWRASLTAAEALRARQAIIDRIPVSAARAARPVVAPAPVPSVAGSASDRGERASSQVSVQSVLAVAGAGLFAVAAIVFTFFNPDLTDLTTRSLIIAAITVVFISGALLFARRNLRFSAEAIGALAAVFLGLDVWAVSRWGLGLGEWTAGAIGLALAGALLLVLAVRARVRVWLWASLAALPLVPVFFAAESTNEWMPVLGTLVGGAVVLGTLELLPRLGERFGSALRTERATAGILLASAHLAVVILVITAGGLEGAARALAVAGALAGLAVLSRLAARRIVRVVWSFLAGAIAVTAGTVASLAIEPVDPAWTIALASAGAAVVAGLVAVLPVFAGASATALRAGATVVATLVAVPAVALAAAQTFLHALRLLVGDLVERFPEFAIASITALAVTAIGVGLQWRRPRLAQLADGSPDPGRGGIPWSAPLLASLALLALPGWVTLAPAVQVIGGVVIAIGIIAVFALVPAATTTPTGVRMPLLVAAHLLVAQSAAIAWAVDSTRVLGGVVVLLGIIALMLRTPRARAVYVTVAYAWALVVVAAALSLTTLPDIAVLSLTTAVAALAAVAATLTRWLDVRSWYGTLVVTAVPFLLAIIGVILERSGWTALSTAVFVALLVTLTLTRRPGLTIALRALSAALIVPAIAVVVISLGAQVLAVSASPITLPIIAVLVAVVLPATDLIRAALERHGFDAPTARSVRLAIEISALITGAIAVVLALLREAAGIPTTFLVLVIIGLGGLATGVFARRRYAWVVAGASFTGALWCVWWLAGIQILEPYLLPPALAAAIIGAILTARGTDAVRATTGLFAAGLAVAVVPVLVVLAIAGSEGAVPWRTLGLLASSTLLLVLAAAVRRGRRLHALSPATLAVAMIAAFAGTVQAVRYALDLDPLTVADPELVMLVALALSAVSALLAALAAVGLPAAGPRLTRWRYVPALLALIIGPISAVRDGWLPILVLLGLALALLAVMIVTTVRARTRKVTLPPVAITFVLAWVTAVASWSERELRVEAFSLPLGLALLACGIIAWRGQSADEVRLRGWDAIVAWPIGFRGSWALLAPGILVTLGPSIMATGTDPRTERAILVIALALVGILLGALLRLAAPFILGIIALPIENIVVFVVQIGQQISALPWWITLATAGAVLLVIAISSERRSTGGGVAARLRDLR